MNLEDNQPTEDYLAGEGDLWVFGYGSLIWKPEFPFEERVGAILHGYHRGLYVLSHAWRGTPDSPGLVLGLDRGGACRGVAFRVAERHRLETLRKLWHREMVTHVYRPVLVKPRLVDGRQPVTRTFVVDRGHEQYAGALDLPEMERLVRQGHGRGGPCIEYVANTYHHLQGLGIEDRGLGVLLRRLNAAARGN